MKETRIIMGMPITIEVIGATLANNPIEKVFSYFKYIDEVFSVYKSTSEITKINKGELQKSEYSGDMKTVFELCEKTKRETDGYFDIVNKTGLLDPSGLVKGWSIYNASKILLNDGFDNFYVDAGGDIQVHGHNEDNKIWSVGIKNPFNQKEIVKTLYLKNEGVATSGTYIRGQHIYNPKNKNEPITEIVSMTIVGSNVYEADRFVTPAFAMGKVGINFVENLPGFEGYMIDKNGIATMTSGFQKYIESNV